MYTVEGRNVEVIKLYINKNNNLPRINSIPYSQEKPLVHHITSNCILVINSDDEVSKVKSNTIQQAKQKVDELVIPINSISIPEIQNLLAEEVRVHLPRVGVILNKHTNVSHDILDSLTPYTDDIVLKRHAGGRAALGTKVQEGFLVKNDDYNEVRETLIQHIEGSVSIEEAADRLETTTRTIERARQRKELYRLQ